MLAKKLLGLFLLAFLLCCQVTIYGAIVPRDSSSFTHLYEGNARPLPDYTEYTRGSPTVSQSGSILSYITADNTQDAYWDSSSWNSEVSSTTGKTIEVSVKAYASPTPGSNGSFNIVAGDGVSGHTILLAIYPNQVEYFTTGTGTVISTADNTDTFHIFRVAQAANSSSYQVWRDGVQIGTDIGGYTPAGAYLDFYFGDGGTYVYGKADIDYVRWDGTGAYSPIAQPNSFRLNGSPFFPIGIYSYPGALSANNYWTLDYRSYLSELSGAGFNTVMCYPTTVTASYINTLMASNIASIVNIGSVCAGYRDYEANDCSGTLGALVGNIKSCSGLLGYYTVDEAYWNYAKDPSTHATLQALTSGTSNSSGKGWLDSQDINHPMFYCEATPQIGMTYSGYNTWSSIADAFAEDSYPIRGTSVPAFPNADLTSVGIAVRHRIDTLPDPTEPVFGVIQGSSSDDDLHDGCRKPTLAEDRFMTYDAIISGARGILWWGCQDLTLGDPKQPEDGTMWANVKNIAGELGDIKDALSAGVNSANFTLGNSNLEAILKIYNGKTYLVVANRSSIPVVGATLSAPSWSTAEAIVLFEGRSLPVSSNTIVDNFDPWGVHVYIDSLPNRYDGDTLVVPGYTKEIFGGATVSQAGGALSYTTSNTSQSVDWASDEWNSQITTTSGFSIEFSVKLYSLPSVGPDGSFMIYAGDGPASDIVRLHIFPNEVVYYTTSSQWGTVISTSDNTDKFHAFRIVEVARTGKYQVWRDDIRIGTNLTGYVAGGSYDGFYFGDGGTDIWGKVDIDYVNWDAGSLFPIADVKKSSIGAATGLSGSITAVFDGTIYLEASNRVSGIRVDKANNGFVPSDVGRVVNVTGIAANDSTTNEFHIDANLINPTSEIDLLEPMGLTNKAVGGGNFVDAITGNGQIGVFGGTGLNNIGLLIRTTGLASAGNTNGFSLTDGSGATLLVSLAGAGSTYDGHYVIVTGVSSIGGGGVRVIKARDTSDVTVVN